MAKSMLERCDLIVGEKEGADHFTAISKRKEGEDTYYAFGAYLRLPAKFKNTGDADQDKVNILWHKRDVSASNAGLAAKIKAGDMTPQEAADIIMSYDGEAYLERLNETKVRAGADDKVDSIETRIIKYLSDMLRIAVKDNLLVTAKVPVPRADDQPKTEKGAVSYNAWAKIVRAEGHPWATNAEKRIAAQLKNVSKDLE